MAYLKTTVHVSRNFEGAVWACYDTAYHCQATNRESYDWADIDTALYNAVFTGRAKALPHCRYYVWVIQLSMQQSVLLQVVSVYACILKSAVEATT